MNAKKLTGLLLTAGLCLSLLAGCGSAAGTSASTTSGSASSGTGTAEDTSLQDVKTSGTLRVGMCPEYAPFESVDSSGSIVGFDPSLAAALAQQLGVKVECVNTPWEGLIAGLNNGDYDVIMSAMSPEEATAATQAVELSDNYYETSDIIVVSASNSDITGKKDLAGKTVGYQTGSSAEQSANSLAKDGIQVKASNPYNRNADAFADLGNGRIDAVIVSYDYANKETDSDSRFKIVNDPLSSVGFTIVAKKGSVGLITALEDGVNTLKSNGTYDSIVSEFLVG